jgi:GTP-binding protein Era
MLYCKQHFTRNLFIRHISIKDLYKFPPKPIDPAQEEEDAKRKELEAINRAKQVASSIQKKRLEKFRSLPVTEPDEGSNAYKYQPPIQPKGKAMSLSVSLMGVANSGKSTLVNRFVGTKISAVSKKASTTISSKLGVSTIDNTQLIFYDTPGILLNKKVSFKVENAWDVLFDSDIAVLVFDCVKTIGPSENAILKRLRELKKEGDEELPPLCLLLNKLDLWDCMPEKDRFPIMDRINMKIPDVNQLFETVHMVSALTGAGIKDFQQYLLSKAKPGPWIYSKEATTDQSPIELCHELVREKVFKHTNMEIPYLVVIDTIGWTELLDGSLRIDQNLIVLKKSHLKILIGKGGKTIQSIKEEAAFDIQMALGRPVILTFEMKVSKYALAQQREYDGE